MHAVIWKAYRLARRLLLPRLSPRDRRDIDELVATRLTRSTSPRRVARVWAYEFGDLVRTSWHHARLRLTSVSLLDVKVGARLLLRQPGLTVAALLTLMVGIPVGLAPVHGVAAFQAPPTVTDGDRLVVLKNFDSVAQRWVSSRLHDYLIWRESLETVESIGAVAPEGFNVQDADGVIPVPGAITTASLFEAFPTAPVLGRTLQPADERADASDVVVLGHGLWQSRYGADAEIIGKSISVGGKQHTVVGVMPEGFEYPAREQIWLPLRIDEATIRPGQGRGVLVFARLAGSEDSEPARAEIRALGDRMASVEPETHAHLTPDVVAYTIGLFPLPRNGLWADPGFYFIQSIAIAVLVIVCTNIGMLMLARTASRSEEIAVRTALGASRARIVTQLFTESLVLAVAAAALGLAVGDAIVARSLTWLEQETPAWVDVGVSFETALLGVALAGLSAAVVAVVPALKVTGKNVQQNMQQSAAGRVGIRFGGVSSALLVADVAIAMLAVAFAAGAWDTQPSGGLGLDAEEYLTAEFVVPGMVPGDDVAAFDPEQLAVRVANTQRNLATRMAGEPGMGLPAYTTVFPGSSHPDRIVEVEDKDFSDGDDDFAGPRVRVASVDRDFFTALEHRVLGGRGFHATDEDRTDGVPVIVNSRFVENVLGGESALGRRLRFQPRPGQEPGPWREIVGVVGELGMDTDNPLDAAGVYELLPRGSVSRVRFAVRIDGNPADASPRLRALLAEVDPTAILLPPVPMNEVLDIDRQLQWWLSIGVLAFIGAVVVLSAMSLYALMSFTVAQRTREIGVRVALGASWRGVARMVGRRAFVQLALGFALGAPFAAWQMSRADFAGARIAAAVGIDIVVLALVGALACLVPMRRALRINPVEALRDG